MDVGSVGDAFERLSRADAYPDDPSAAGAIDWIQTHLSHVYRTGDRVYKFRKPVDLGFVHFETRAERNADCLREVALNRRLAPDVYLGVAALHLDAGRCRVGPPTEQIGAGENAAEHCVVMRRLPDGRDALSLLEGGALTGSMLDRVAARLAAFHADQCLGRPAPFSAELWFERILTPIEDCFKALASLAPNAVPNGLAEQTLDRAREFAKRHAARFERRRLAGYAVDGHGDLHLQHIWFERDDAEPTIIDCLEFDANLRRIDAASEVAFLAMDLRYRAELALAERFLRMYAALSDDFELYHVVEFFIAYRAAVRARVASIAMSDRAIDPQQRNRASQSVVRHLELAAAALTARPHGSLVLVGGVVGTGKSTVASALADAANGVVIASDRVRKRAATRSATEPGAAGVDQGLYAPECVDAVYAGLLERAAAVVKSGRVAILDATFARRAHRAAATRWAEALGIPMKFVEVRCTPEIALERLRVRAAAGNDASDAGPELLATSVERFEPFTDDESPHVIRTDTASWRVELADLVRGWRN